MQLTTYVTRMQPASQWGLTPPKGWSAIPGIVFLRLFHESWHRSLTDMESTIHFKVVATGLGFSAWHTGAGQLHQSRQGKGKRCQTMCL